MNQGIHAIDAFLYLAGPSTSARAASKWVALIEVIYQSAASGGAKISL